MLALAGSRPEQAQQPSEVKVGLLVPLTDDRDKATSQIASA
jgi:hypothetical protein